MTYADEAMTGVTASSGLAGLTMTRPSGRGPNSVDIGGASGVWRKLFERRRA